MSASNCPETPRQRMIGMMYLFLTAMLAINVSPQVLEGFILVDEGLRKSNENFELRNKDIYDAFATQYKLNPIKVEHWNNGATSVKAKADTMVNFIQHWKEVLAKTADGPLGHPDSLQSKDNYDIPGQIMLPATKQPKNWPGVELKNRLETYRAELIGLIDPREAILRSAIESNLDTSAPTGTEEGIKTWEQNLFSEVPMAAVMALMSKLQNDVRNTETMAIQYLFRQITAKDFKVNDVEALIIPTSTYIVKGGKLEAKILLAASDTTKRPEIEVNGTPLPLDAKGIYEKICNETGNKTLSARIIIEDDQGNKTPYDQTLEYQVVEPFATVSATKMNVLYAGVENPISISVPGIPANKIEARLGGINLPAAKDGKGYIAIPKKPGNTKITVFAEIDGKTQQIGTGMPFRVKALPDPLGFIVYKKKVKNAQGKLVDQTVKFRGGNITKGQLLSSSGLIAELPDADFEIKYKLTGFDITLFDTMGNAKVFKSDGAKFTTEQIRQIKTLQPGKTFYIGSIKALAPDGLTKDIPPIKVKLY